MAHTVHTTQRLQLTPPVPADGEAVFAIAGDPRTWAHIPGERVTDPARTAELLAMYRAGWRLHGLSNWAVRLGQAQGYPGLAQGRLLGTGGVHLFESASGAPVWNLGYRLDPACWGHGFATELAGHAVACARVAREDVPVVARVLSTNPASARVARKAGLEPCWEGSPSARTRAAVGDAAVKRSILADRELEPEVLAWLVSLG